MDPETLRVHAPSSVVFLCGGAISPSLSPPLMLRDAFLRIVRVSAPDYKIILAEDAKPLVADAGYDNLLLFESDIAQVVGQILLFVESPGSLAELGAFAALDTVSPRLLVVLDEYYYNRSSFVKQGPLRYLAALPLSKAYTPKPMQRTDENAPFRTSPGTHIVTRYALRRVRAKITGLRCAAKPG